jgi:cell division protein FtsZ
LLDDINLSGANGILVNITAGPDFTMAEFDEVGRTIENFASEDATVVIGTVLDPDMQDEVKVTVVATGLNRAVARQTVNRADFGRGDLGQHQQVNRAPIKLVRNATTGQPDFDAMANAEAAGGGAPSFASALRGGRGSSSAEPAQAAPAVAELPNDYLDIPAFLRRQAD